MTAFAARALVLTVLVAGCSGQPGEVAGELFADPPGATTSAQLGAEVATTVASTSTGPPTSVGTPDVDPPGTSLTITTIRITTTATPTTAVPPTTSLLPTTGWPAGSWVDPGTIGQPWGSVPGVLTFRGSPTRSWHGTGPVPVDPVVAWRFPRDGKMCSLSVVGDVEKEWCGVGWTGQPAVFQRDGHTWVVFGGLDGRVHFIDGITGARRLPDFTTGDLAKGSVTVDPDGYPLVYVGSRDDLMRVIAFDRDEPVELWSLHAEDSGQPLWNTDWDAAPLVLADHLFAAGENSRFHVVRLRRGYDADGLVTVDPDMVWFTHGWDNQLIADVGYNLSIENSPLVIGDTLWFANSGGLVQGWDIAGLAIGVTPRRIFRFWAGDDVDATLVPDAEGMLYVAVEYERETDRSHELGQVIKLDPSNPSDPLVWALEARSEAPSGVWSTPAVHRDLLIVATDDGEVLGIDREVGSVRWTLQLPRHLWSSPTVVDDVMVIGDCAPAGRVLAFDVADTSVVPPLLWEVPTGACIEASATIWNGTVYMGSRDGYMYALRDRR